MKKLFIIILIVGLPILIYLMTVDRGVYYVALGDSLAAGQNPYGKISYGYTDYVADYLSSNKKLTFYTKDFATNGYRTTDLIRDINDNKSIDVNNQKVTIKQALAKADLITLSVGTTDLFYKLGINSMDITFQNNNEIKKYINEVILDVEKLIVLIRKYCMEDIILIGYYNPLWQARKDLARDLDSIFVYVNEEMKKISERYNLYFVDIHKEFEQSPDFLPNPIDIHPSAKGYEAISKKIINIVKAKVLN